MSNQLIRSTIVCVLLATAPLSLAGGIDYTNPSQGVFLDEWSAILLNGQKCGYTHAVLSRQGNTIKSMTLETFKIARANWPITATQLMTTEETLDGQPLAFACDSDMATQKVRQQGIVRDGKVTLRSEQYGNAITETFDYPKRALMTWAMMRRQEEKGYAPGTAYELASYIPLMVSNQGITVKVAIEGMDEIEIAGQKRKAIRSTQEMILPGMPVGLKSTVWIDPEDHQLIRITMQMMGMQMELVACAREEALADFEPPEAFMDTLVRVAQPIDEQAARRIKMKLSLAGDGPDMPPLPQTGMQTPAKADARSVVLEVRRQDHAALAKAQPVVKINREAYAEFLEPNIYINADDPVVRKMAEEAAGKAKAPYEIADRLRRYVGEKIEHKNLNIGFASASEVARNRSGDCSEHAVFLAALARVKGIPSRVVCGLVYVPSFGQTHQVFGFHMWTQLFISGQWVDFDAGQNESACNPTHIALAVDSLRDSGLGELAFAILPVISRLSIEVLEIEPTSK